MEGVQRCWTKAVTGLDHLSYVDRFIRLNLFSVQGRLLRADLIQYWKIPNNKSCIPPSSLFILHPSPTPRGHPLNILTPYTSTDIHQLFFSFQCIHIWNCLLSETFCANDLHSFKKSLEGILKDKLYTYIDGSFADFMCIFLLFLLYMMYVLCLFMVLLLAERFANFLSNLHSVCRNM